MLRVGFEETGLELDSTGTARAIRELRAALERRSDVELVPLAHPGARDGASRVRRGLAREGLWLPFGLPRAAHRLRLDVLHCAIWLAPAFGTRGVPLAVTVHDALALEHPEWFTRANVLQQRHVLGPALRRADVVLTPSSASAAAVERAFGVPAERVAVAPLGVDARFSPGAPPPGMAERLGLDGPWILTVGTLQPRKNLEGALAAFELLHASGLPHRLAVAGARGWGEDELLRRLEASPAASAIRLLGRVSDEDLVGLYRGAGVLLFPSRGEGFGVPAAEAMACGTPVVAADRGSLPEVVGDGGLLADPDDPEALAAATRETLARSEELSAAALRRAQAFSWDRCAELTVAAYADAIRRVRGTTRPPR